MVGVVLAAEVAEAGAKMADVADVADAEGHDAKFLSLGFAE